MTVFGVNAGAGGVGLISRLFTDVTALGELVGVGEGIGVGVGKNSDLSFELLSHFTLAKSCLSDFIESTTPRICEWINCSSS